MVHVDNTKLNDRASAARLVLVILAAIQLFALLWQPSDTAYPMFYFGLTYNGLAGIGAAVFSLWWMRKRMGILLPLAFCFAGIGISIWLTVTSILTDDPVRPDAPMLLLLIYSFCLAFVAFYCYDSHRNFESRHQRPESK